MMRWLVIAFLVGVTRLQAAPAPEPAPELWTLAQKSADIHCFSTLFDVKGVQRYLSSDADIAEAIRWCKASGVTKVYLEEYRDGQQAERRTLMRARDRFRAAGFVVSGCVTTTGIGKPSEGGSWTSLSCFTDAGTQNQVQAAFEFAASLFDERSEER